MERRLIDANALLDGLDENCGDLDLQYNSEYAKMVHYIDAQPTIDAVEVVRCRECKRHRKEGCINTVWCGKWASPRLPDDYCNYGERREPDGK